MLSQILPGLGTTTQLATDPRANQILLRGPEAAHQAARQLIESIDRATPPGVSSPAVVRMYPCPADRQADVVTRMQNQWAGRDDVRVAANPQAGQIFVLAPPEIHEAITRQLATPPALPSPPVPVVSANPVPTAVAPFVMLGQVRVEQIEATLFQLLGSRLVAMPNPLPNGAQYVFVDAAGKRLELSIDRARNGITVIGPEPLAGQFVRLVQHLDRPASPGRTQRIVPVHRADPAKVEQAVKAYRTGGRDEGAAVPRGGSGSNDAQARGAIGLVGYLFQPADAVRGSAVQQAVAMAAAPATTPVVPATPTTPTTPIPPVPPVPLRNVASDVEVEVLPDLDVIILRGREQDVSELTRIIEELERLSAETQPSIEVCPLQHVGSDALTTLIARVQDSLLGGSQGRVSITPLGKPNALLLIGWGDAVRAAKELITKLDQPVSAEAQFKVFPLKHAPANSARTTVQEIFTNRTGLASRVQVSADVRTNSLLVQASPRDMIEAAAIIENLDRGESASVNQTRIYKLKNTLAADLATTLQAAIAASRGGSPTATATAASGGKSSTLELVTIDPAGRKILKSGILADVQITADPHLNTLIISAPAESMELVVALVQQLDVPVATAQIKVFRIVNGDATNLTLMLRSLLLRPETGTTVAPLPLSQDESTLAPLRFSVDTRTNSIIAVGGSSDLRIVEALLLRLDQQDVAERKNAVYRLKNAPATDVATAINEFLRSERQVQQAAPGVTSASQQMESEVVVVPEQVSNALIVSATPRYFQKICDLIEKLDEQPAQVLIQVVIAEVKLSNYDEFGIELGLQDSVLFDRSLLGNLVTTTSTITNAAGTAIGNQQSIVAASNTPGFNFNNGESLGNSGTGSSVAGRNLVGGQSIANFGVGRNSSKTGYSGLVLSASSESVSALLRAMQELSCARIISRPQIMTLDNQPAFVQVGQRVPRITGTAINNVGQVNSVALENVGIILGVTPRISPEGLVVMEVDAEKSEVDTTEKGTEVAISSGVPIYSPYINVTTAQTTVSASSGETIILGGLIAKGTEQIDRRVPWLADIPVLGNLFRYKSNYMDRRELLIILTPHVVRNQAEQERVRQLEASRMHWCLRDLNQIHGDVNVVPAAASVPTIYPDSNPRGVVPDAPQPMPEGAKPAEPVFPPPPPVPKNAKSAEGK